MRSGVSAHARARAQLREVAGAAFYTHVATLARQPDDAAVGNRPEDVGSENWPEDLGGENWPEILRGQNRPEILRNENRPEVLRVGNRPEILRGENRPEFLRGENRPEILRGENRLEILRGENRPEILRGENRPEILRGENRPEVLRGENRPEILRGENRPEILRNENRPEILRGENRPEILRGENRPEILRGENRPEILRNENRPEILRSENRPEILRNENRPEILRGENRPEILRNENRPEILRGENRPEDLGGKNRSKEAFVDWERSLIAITLPPKKHRRSSEYFHPRDPRRQRQLKRERDEFAANWRKENNNEKGQDGDEWRSDDYEGVRDEDEENFHGNRLVEGAGKGVGGRRVALITIGENEDESEVMARTAATGRKRSLEEDNGRRNRDELTRSSSGSKMDGRSSSSKTTKHNRIVWRDQGSSEALSTSSTTVDEGEPVGAKRSKITKDDSRFPDTPELLDERVGYANPFIVSIPRKAITLNLSPYNSHNGGSAKKDTSRPSTEIRLADSSVPDLAPSGNEESVVPVEKSKKPKIIDDVTCLEGTILPRTSLKKLADEPAKATRRKRTSEVDEKSARNRGEDDPPRRSRIREKFRRLFGNDVTLSESDEEKRITARLTSRKRRNESRMSSDSGVCLNEHTSDVVCSEALEKQGDSENPGEFPREKFGRSTGEDLGEYAEEHLGEYPREKVRRCTEEGLGEYAEENLGGYPRENVRKNTREKVRRDNEGDLGGYPRENVTKHIREKVRRNTEEDLGEYADENLGEYPREQLRKNTREEHREHTEENLRECPREYLRKNSRENPEEYTGKKPKASPKECVEKNPRENSTRKPSEFPSEDPKEFPKDDRREFPSEDPAEVSSMKIEDMESESEQVLSMPLLDPVCEQRAEEARGEALPDSSTSLSEKIPPQPDSSSGGKLTILVTPLNIQDSDAFDPLRLELDLSQEAQISTPTSTTSGPPIVEPIKLESSFEDRQNPVGTCVGDSYQIDDPISVKEDLSPEAETESCDGDRLIIAEDLETEYDATRECEASEESPQGIPEIPILSQWRSDSTSGPEKRSSNETDVNSSSDSKTTATTNLPIEKVAKTETTLEVRENIPKDLKPETSSGAHQKVLIISARIVDFDPASGMLVGPGETVKVSDETSPQTVDLNSDSSPEQLQLDETIVSNDPLAKLSEVTTNDSLTDERKSVNLDLEFELNGLTTQDLEDRTKDPKSFDHEVPDSEIPKCVFDAQKPKDVPKAPNFRVLHPSELGSRWCPTPLVTEVPQNQPRLPPMPAIAQPRFAPNPAIAHPPLYPPLPRYPNSQTLRNPSYPPIRQPPPEVLIQTPPPSPLEQMQFLVSQTSSSAHGVEDLSCKKSSGYVNVALGPRPAHTGSGLSPSWTMDKHQNWTTSNSSPNAENPLEKQYSLMRRIFECLMSMASLIERIRRESDMARIHQIDKDYVAKKASLFVELGQFACMQGINDLRVIVAKIMNYYDYLVPPDRRTLNIKGVEYMLQLERAAMVSHPYCPRPAGPRPPPPYRPNRPSVMQSSPFTESQRHLLYNQMTTYYCLHSVLQYQLAAQRCAQEDAARAKGTRRRNPRAPAGQNQAVQAPAAGGRDRPNPSTTQNLRRIAPAGVDQPCTLQQTMECSIERIGRKEGVGNCTITDKRHKEIVELALRDANMDKTVADIVDELFRQHPTERMAEGQAVERNPQGRIGMMKLQGQNMAGNIQGQSVDVNVQRQNVDLNVQEQRTDINTQGQSIDMNVQGQTIDVTFQGQSIESNVQSRSVEENVQFQAVERNAQDKTIESSAQCQTTEKNLRDQIIGKSVQGQAIYTNDRGQTAEGNVQVQSIGINVEGQDIKKSSQGQIIPINVEGQDDEKSSQGQIIPINVEGQDIEKSSRGQFIETSIQGQAIEKSRQGQIIERTVQGQIIERTVQGPAIDINIRGQCTEKSLQGQNIIDVEAQTNEANVAGQAMKKSVQFDPIEVNARAEVIDDNVQGQAIVKKGSPVESVLDRSTSSLEDGNTSVLDVLKEFEVLDSITKGPHSRRSKTTKSPEDKLPDSIAKERGSKAADPTCPEDSPSPTTTSAETGGKTDNHTNLGPSTSADVAAGSSRIVPVITIDDDEDWDLASTNSVETVRDAADATVVDEISILDVKSISKDVFNNMGVKVDDAVTKPVATTDDEPMVYDESEQDCIGIKTELSDCFQCGKRSEVVCEQCRLAAYCSPECHQEHWSSIHYLTCKPAPQEIIETTE